MRMKHLVERCEREVLVEFDPGAIAAGVMMASPVVAAAGVMGATIHGDKKDAMVVNKRAEYDYAKKRPYRCANGYHMDDNGKCVKSKGLGPKIVRNIMPIERADRDKLRWDERGIGRSAYPKDI